MGIDPIRIKQLKQMPNEVIGELMEASFTAYGDGLRSRTFTEKVKVLYEVSREEYPDYSKIDSILLATECGNIKWTTPSWPCDFKFYYSFITDEDDFGGFAGCIYTDRGSRIQDLLDNPIWEGLDRSNI